MTAEIRRLEQFLAAHAQCGGEGVFSLIKAGVLEAWCHGCRKIEGEENLHVGPVEPLSPAGQEQLAVWAIRYYLRHFELVKVLRHRLIEMVGDVVPSLDEAARDRLRRALEDASPARTMEPATPPWLKQLLDGLSARLGDGGENTKGGAGDAS